MSQLQKIIDFCNTAYGSGRNTKFFDYRRNTHRQSNQLCQAFVASAWKYAGLGDSSFNSAAEARNFLKRKGALHSMSETIPVGACLYRPGNHVAIYVGDGYIIHAGTTYIRKTKWKSDGQWSGWGWNNNKKPSGSVTGGSGSVSGSKSSTGSTYRIVPAEFTGYYPANNAMEGGFLDCQGKRLDPSKHTCAAPKSIPYGTSVMPMSTGWSGVDNVVHTVNDRGGAIVIKSDGTYCIDILFANKTQANSFGRRKGKLKIYNYYDGSDDSGGSDSTQREITSVAIKEVYGAAGEHRYKNLKGLTGITKTGAEILIENDKIYMPVLADKIELTRERAGAPASLKFTVIKDKVLNIQEGNPVAFRYNGAEVFYGYIFKKSRSDNTSISITAYDQLRYFKNKDSFVYANMTAAALVKELCNRYDMRWGYVEDSKFVIPSKIAENTLLDIIDEAISDTLMNTNNLFVLYDDFGKVSFRNWINLHVPILICEDTAESYSYESSIDDSTYSRVKIALDNKETGEREIYMAQDKEAMDYYGILQYYENINDGTAEVAMEKAKLLLEANRKKTRTLKISKCFGDVRVRGGSWLYVALNLGDIDFASPMMVESVKHVFENGLHTMDLTLRGGAKDGDFIV